MVRCSRVIVVVVVMVDVKMGGQTHYYSAIVLFVAKFRWKLLTKMLGNGAHFLCGSRVVLSTFCDNARLIFCCHIEL